MSLKPTTSTQSPSTSQFAELPEGLMTRFQTVRPWPIPGSQTHYVLASDTQQNDQERLVSWIDQANPDFARCTLPQAAREQIADTGLFMQPIELGKLNGYVFEVYDVSGLTSLREAMQAPLLPEQVEPVLRIMADALDCLHGLRCAHGNLRPETVLIRQAFPLQLALLDLPYRTEGAANLYDSDNQPGYQAPETSFEARRRADWWSLGLLLTEMLTGLHPLEGLSKTDIDDLVCDRRVDLGAIDNPRWLTLLGGLLSPALGDRWGSTEVRRWLKGDQLQASTLLPHPPVAHVVRPYRLLDRQCHDAHELAQALAKHWSEAGKHLQRGLVLDWVHHQLCDYTLTSLLMDLMEDDKLNPDARLVRTIYGMYPHLPPSWQGHPVDLGAIKFMAKQARTDANALEHFVEFIQRGLPYYPHEELRDLNARLQSAHSEFVEFWLRANGQGAVKPGQAEAQRALPELILTLLSANNIDHLREQLSSGLAQLDFTPPWFAGLTNPDELSVPALAACLTMLASTQPEREPESESESRTRLFLECREKAVRLRARLDQLNVGDSFSDCSICPEMVVIPAGSFVMGSPHDEPERSGTEGPQHQVSIGYRFALGKFCVTFDEYDVYARDSGVALPNDRGWGRGRRPVINISWQDAQAYLAWLNAKLGLTGASDRYRLPSEAEWEYACRAGNTGPFTLDIWQPEKSKPSEKAKPNRDQHNFLGRLLANFEPEPSYTPPVAVTIANIQPDLANYNAEFSYENSPLGPYRGQTLEVGSFPANPWGLHEMHGNVLEWVEDLWHKTYDQAPADGSPWTSGPLAAGRVRRGGSWYSYPRYLRSACRYRSAEQERTFDYVGFRIARTLSADLSQPVRLTVPMDYQPLGQINNHSDQISNDSEM